MTDNIPTVGKQGIRYHDKGKTFVMHPICCDLQPLTGHCVIFRELPIEDYEVPIALYVFLHNPITREDGCHVDFQRTLAFIMKMHWELLHQLRDIFFQNGIEFEVDTVNLKLTQRNISSLSDFDENCRVIRVKKRCIAFGVLR